MSALTFAAQTVFPKRRGVRTGVWKPIQCAAVVLWMLLASIAQAQDWHFVFDANGNLVVQTAEIDTPPQILGQPKDRIVSPDELATFTVVAANPRGMTYQWSVNNTQIPGATNDTIVLRNVSTNSEGAYRVELRNSSGSVTSAPAILWIDSDSDGQPDSWERKYFSNLNQNATADFDRDGVSNLAEFLDDTNPTNRLSAQFSLTILTDGDGIVESNPTGINYTNGQSVVLTATARDPHRFHGWTGAIQSTNNPLQLTISSNTTVRAHFQFLPQDIVWTNTAGGDWHSAANWSPNQVPGLANNAIILMAANVTIRNPAECQGLTLGNNPTLDGDGTLLIQAHLQWTLGSMRGSGRTILNTNATANIPASATLSARTLENRGTILVYNTGGLNIVGGGVLTNCAGALVHIVNEIPTLGGGVANGRFDNAGTVLKSSGTGTLTVSSKLEFNNSGTVDIQSGQVICEGSFNQTGVLSLSSGITVRLAGGGSSTGSFDVPDSALVEWTKGSFAINPGTRLQGNGLYRVNGGTLLANAEVDFNRLELRNGTLGGSGTVSITNQMNWAGGAMTDNGRTLISAGATLLATLPSGGSLNGRTLENRGIVRWTGAANIGFVNAVITNCAEGLFHNEGNGGMAFVSGANRFENNGIFRKSTSQGVMELSSGGSFNNRGTVEILTGTWLCRASLSNAGLVRLAGGTTNQFGGGGSNTGIFETPTDAIVEWIGGTFNLNPAAELRGSGLYRLNGISAAVRSDGDIGVQHLELVNGSSTWGGTGKLTINGSMRWTAGTMDGIGRTVIGPNSTLLIANPNSVGLQRTIENAGAVDWTGPGLIGMLNGVITNRPGAVFTAPSSGRIAYSGGNSHFDNAGTFRKLGPPGTLTIDPGLPFSNLGTVFLESGVLEPKGGYLSSEASLLRLGVSGTTPGSGHAQLRLPGQIQLAGGLELEFLSAFSPQVNDTLVVVNAGSRTGSFQSFKYPASSVTMELSNTINSVIAVVKELHSAVPPPEFLPTTTSGNHLVLTWTSKSNVSYRLEFVPDLSQSAAASWNPIPGDVLAVGSTTTKLDPLTSSNRFYRVRVLP